jgi:quercetin dioxygenase-like cupin family protein
MKVNINNISGKVIRDTPVYIVEDNALLKNLTLSSTILHPLMATAGHAHPGLEEVYYFTKGKGRIQLSDDFHTVTAGDIILIEDGVFHKVYNDSAESDLEFVCVFQKYNR